MALPAAAQKPPHTLADKQVCCRTSNGHQQMLASRCRQVNGTQVSAAHCGPIQAARPKTQVSTVCCKTRQGFVLTLKTRCRPPNGSVVNDRLCRQPPTPGTQPQPQLQLSTVCCQFVDPAGVTRFELTDLRSCAVKRGSAVNERLCRQPPRPAPRRK